MAADLTGAAFLSRTRERRDFVIPSQPEVRVGYDRSNDVVVAYEGVSRRHAKLTFDGKDYWIEDIGSANGTFLNAARLLQPERLKHLDVVTLGRRADLIFVRRTVEAAPRKAKRGILSARLEILDGLDAGMKREIPRGSVTVGRTAGNNIVADSQLVSKVHARIERSGLELVLTDLQSANGTFVNGERIDSRVLRDGDEISVGRARSYRVRIEEGEVLTGDVAVSNKVSTTHSNSSLPLDWRTHLEWSPEEAAEFDRARAKLRGTAPPGGKGATAPAPAVADGKADKAAKPEKPAKAAPATAPARAEAPAEKKEKEEPPKPEKKEAPKPAAAEPRPAEKPAERAAAAKPAAEPKAPAAPAPKPEPPAAEPKPPPPVEKPGVERPAATAPAAPTPKSETPAAPKPGPPAQPAPPPASASAPPPTPPGPPPPTPARSPVPVPPATPASAAPREATATRALTPDQLPRIYLESPARTFPLAKGAFAIGRDPGSDVRLESSEISRFHAKLTVTDETATVEDLRTVNGTYVNREKLAAPRALADGDEIAFGSLRFKIRFGAGFPANKPKG